MALQELVKSTTLGQYIQVGSVTSKMRAGVNLQYTAYGSPNCTVLDFNSNCQLFNKIRELPSVSIGEYNTLFNLHRKDLDISTYKQKLESSSVWLWGSLDEGGVFIARDWQNRCAWGFCNGLYETVQGGVEYEKYNTSLFSNFYINDDHQVVICYWCTAGTDGDQQAQNEVGTCSFIDYNVSHAEDLKHYNAVWIGTTPSYVVVDNVRDLLYLDNGGFKRSITDGSAYPNSGVSYIYGSIFYDDTMRNPAGEGWYHVSGTVFSGKIHKDPYNGGTGDQGGGGLLDDIQDGVEPPDVTDTGILGTGILSLFNPSAQDMTNFANFLYSTLTSGDADALKKLFMNPMDYIICLNMTRLDISLNTSGLQVVHMGGIDTSVTMPKIVNQFVTYSGGSVTIQPQYNFTDYSPYTKLQIYIPYCGQHELPIDLLQGGTLYLTYNVDLLSGALTAILSVTRNRKSYLFNVEQPIENFTTLTYTGNIYCAVPIGSVDNRQYVSSLIGMASSALTSVASGNPLPLVGMAANAAMSSKQTVSHNGSIGSTMGFLANQQAFLIRSRPAVNVPDNYSMWKGYPSNRFGAIKDFTEFVKVDSNTLWTDKFTKDITETECLELKQIVNDGIYIPV